MEISLSDVHEILRILDETESLDEVEVVLGDLRIHVRRNGAGNGTAGVPMVMPPASQPALSHEQREVRPPAQAPTRVSSEIPEGMHAIKAPMLGTFYRSPSPGEPPFVQVGQRVKADDTVAVIEVMKLFNSISADVDGVIVDVLAQDATLVEFGQVIVLVKAD